MYIKKERKEEGSRQGEYTLTWSTQRTGGVAPRRNNLIRHQVEHGSENISEEGDTRNKRKTKNEKAKTKKEGENGERQQGRGTKGKRQRCPGGTTNTKHLGLNRGDAS